MWVELDLGNNLDDAERLAMFLQEHGYDDFHIQADLFAPPKGFWVRRARVTFKDYYPADSVTVTELTSKIRYFKETCERQHQQILRLKRRLEKK
jgi:hypothetical protein